ncbi:hypothetical protein HDU96_005146, partial [Phlyctochytrium bullatum]
MATAKHLALVTKDSRIMTGFFDSIAAAVAANDWGRPHEVFSHNTSIPGFNGAAK